MLPFEKNISIFNGLSGDSREKQLSKEALENTFKVSYRSLMEHTRNFVITEQQNENGEEERRKEDVGEKDIPEVETPPEQGNFKTNFEVLTWEDAINLSDQEKSWLEKLYQYVSAQMSVGTEKFHFVRHNDRLWVIES